MDLNSIERIVSKVYGIPDILDRSRKSNIVEARAVFFWLCVSFTKMSYLKIAKIYGFTHANVLHHVNRVEGQLDYDKKFKEKVDKCISEINKMC